MKNCYLIDFNPIGNEDVGYLVELEENKQIPFNIKRVYYTHSVPDETQRGFHAHKNLEQVLICLNGKIKVKCFDGEIAKIYELNCNNKGLYVGGMVWLEMLDYTKEAILLVLASQIYNEDDYIRNFGEFIKIADNFNSKKNKSIE